MSVNINGNSLLLTLNAIHRYYYTSTMLSISIHWLWVFPSFLYQNGLPQPLKVLLSSSFFSFFSVGTGFTWAMFWNIPITSCWFVCICLGVVVSRKPQNSIMEFHNYLLFINILVYCLLAVNTSKVCRDMNCWWTFDESRFSDALCPILSCWAIVCEVWGITILSWKSPLS